jgi:16S rRNA (adenine1518-N6/adenine1519-N6)-dimethyltransferase
MASQKYGRIEQAHIVTSNHQPEKSQTKRARKQAPRSLRNPQRSRKPVAHVRTRDQEVHQIPSSQDAPETAQTAETLERARSINLANADEVRALLRRHGLLRANKALGQHLLVSKAALRSVVDAAELTPDDAALEVGAGHGALTMELARRARRVVAVELDRAILPVLRETTAPYPNVEIVERNLLDVEPEDLFGAEPYKLVANLPYYITAATLRHFLEARNPPRLLVVMVQREVAVRMVAHAGEMSLLSLSVQFYGAPCIVAQVPASAFYPPPKVESAIVRIDLHPAPLSREERDWFFTLARAGFAEKRKQVHNSLARHLDVDPARIQDWLNAANIEPTRRAQTLSLEDWMRLTAVSAPDVRTMD